MTDVTLKPCPFCGGTEVDEDSKAAYFSRGTWHWLVCVRCYACGPRRRNQEEARASWNTRVADPAAEARIAELVAEVAALKAPTAYHYHDVDDFYKPETCERCKWFNDHDIMWCDREGGPGESTGTREAPSCDRWEGKEDS